MFIYLLKFTIKVKIKTKSLSTKIINFELTTEKSQHNRKIKEEFGLFVSYYD